MPERQMFQHEICVVEGDKLDCSTYVLPSLILNPDTAREEGLEPTRRRSADTFDIPGGTTATVGRETGGLYLTVNPKLLVPAPSPEEPPA